MEQITVMDSLMVYGQLGKICLDVNAIFNLKCLGISSCYYHIFAKSDNDLLASLDRPVTLRKRNLLF